MQTVLLVVHLIIAIALIGIVLLQRSEGGALGIGGGNAGSLFSARPVLGFADYRSPVRGLYLCGAGAHPGGGVTGAPGHNAAREILRDFRRR